MTNTKIPLQHGLMTMTCVEFFFFHCTSLFTYTSLRWVPIPVPDDIAFEAIKTSLDAVPPGVKMLLNAGNRASCSCLSYLSSLLAEFYGEAHDFTANLDLLARFFEKYPEYADKAFLSVKVRCFTRPIRTSTMKLLLFFSGWNKAQRLYSRQFVS
jgi:hypothetical protein